MALSVEPDTKGSQFEQKKRTVVKEGINNSINNKWASLMCMLALSSVIKRVIRTVYPQTGGIVESVFNGKISPRHIFIAAEKGELLNIMWSRVASLTKVTSFQPNHFVPLEIRPVRENDPEPKAKKLKFDKEDVTGIYIIVILKIYETKTFMLVIVLLLF